MNIKATNPTIQRMFVSTLRPFSFAWSAGVVKAWSGLKRRKSGRFRVESRFGIRHQRSAGLHLRAILEPCSERFIGHRGRKIHAQAGCGKNQSVAFDAVFHAEACAFNDRAPA